MTVDGIPDTPKRRSATARLITITYLRHRSEVDLIKVTNVKMFIAMVVVPITTIAALQGTGLNDSGMLTPKCSIEPVKTNIYNHSL